MRKTKLIALLLAVAMIASMVVPGVAADTPAYDPTQVACPCARCNGTVPAWEIWSGTEKSGHYYMTGDITLGMQINVGDDNFVLNLNSYDVICGVTTASGNGSRFYIGDGKTGTLDFMDATAYTDPEGNYVAGEIRGGSAEGSKNAYQRGGNICSYGTAESRVTIHSGKITGGSAVRGGNIYVDGGSLYIYGGEISGGTASWNGSEIMTYGGDVSAYIYGGSIVGNTAKNAIHTMNSNTDIFGGSINNIGSGNALVITGSSEGNAANTRIYGGSVGKIGTLTFASTLTMFGGSIGTLSEVASTSTVTMYNGEVTTAPAEGFLADCACAQETADGTFVIWNYDDTCTDCAYETALASYADYIDVQTGEHSAPVADSNSSTGWACGYCGTEMIVSGVTTRTCSVHGEQSYFAWEGQSTTGHYYLTADVALDGIVTVAAGEIVCIDLAGCDITAPENEQAFINNGELYIVDTVGGGTIYGNGSVSSSGGVIKNNGIMHLYGGTVANGIVIGTGRYGGNIYNAGTFYMYAGATVTGGQSEGHGGNISSGNGSYLYIYGGTITNGTTGVYEGAASTNFAEGASMPMGGNVYVTASNAEGGCEAIISNATITGGRALLGSGGNVMINNHRKNTTITGCTITGGSAADGAHNLYMSQTALVLVTDTTIGAVAEDANTEIPAFSVRSSETGYQLRIGAGVTTYEDPTRHLYECALLTDASEGVYKTYATLTDALTNAESGDKVTMGADAEANEITVNNGITLDLNGKTLTANAMTSASTDAHVIDSIGTAKLVVEKLNASFMTSNNQLPVYNDGAYTFEEVTVKEKLTATETTATYKFYIDSEAAQTLLDDAILAGNDVAIDVYVTWKDAAGVGYEQTFTLGTELLEQYAGAWDAKMIVLTISDIDGITDLDCTARVISGGVTVEA